MLLILRIHDRGGTLLCKAGSSSQGENGKHLLHGKMVMRWDGGMQLNFGEGVEKVKGEYE